MQNELMRYTQGQESPPSSDRRVAKRAKQSYDETRMRAFQADGAMALAAHLMQGLTDLDQYRRNLAKDDPSLNMMLAEVQATAIRQASDLQRSLTANWGF